MTVSPNTPDMSLQAVERLRALSERATPGPWSWEQCGEKEDVPVVGIAFSGDDHDCKAPYEGEFRDSDANRMTIAFDWQSCDGHSPSANAAFAVAAVNFVRAALEATPSLHPEGEGLDPHTIEQCARVADANAATSVLLMKGLGVAASVETGRHRAGTEIAAAIRALTPSTVTEGTVPDDGVPLGEIKRTWRTGVETGRLLAKEHIIAEARKNLALTQGCLDCNADDERRWADTTRWLEGLA